MLKAPTAGTADLGDGSRTKTVVVAELDEPALFCNEN